jgi:hypothetical protein
LGYSIFSNSGTGFRPKSPPGRNREAPARRVEAQDTAKFVAKIASSANLTKLYSFGKAPVSPFLQSGDCLKAEKKRSCGQAAPVQGSPYNALAPCRETLNVLPLNLLVVRVDAGFPAADSDHRRHIQPSRE